MLRFPCGNSGNSSACLTGQGEGAEAEPRLSSVPFLKRPKCLKKRTTHRYVKVTTLCPPWRKPHTEETQIQGQGRTSQDGSSHDGRWEPRALIPVARSGLFLLGLRRRPRVPAGPGHRFLPPRRAAQNRRVVDGAARSAPERPHETRPVTERRHRPSRARGGFHARDDTTEGSPPDAHAAHDAVRCLPGPWGVPVCLPFPQP